MSLPDSTKIFIEGVESVESPPSTLAWSFGTVRSRMFSAVAPRHGQEPNGGAANKDEDATSGMQRIDVPGASPVSAPATHFGKRGLSPLAQWEGVVEAVTEEGFKARLVPFENGKPNVARVEFSDFDYEDLADESDEELVGEGAVFYWTLGRSRNAAGTITNVSLVRFRRLPQPGPHQRELADAEARELMRNLAAPPSS